MTHISANSQQTRTLFWRSAMLVAVAALAVAGCAAVKPAPPELQVRQLATQRWQALLAGNLDKAYTFSAPAYRLIHSVDTYKNNHQAPPVKWLSAEVLTVECLEAKCTARIRLQSKPMLPFSFKGVIDSGIDETWIQEDGQWWLLENL